jgi:hypothetical protein
LSRNGRSLNLLEPSGPVQVCIGVAFIKYLLVNEIKEDETEKTCASYEENNGQSTKE